MYASCRLALRATGGKVAEAAVFAQKKREEKARVEKQEKELRKKRRKYGKTVDGSLVNVGYMKTLTAMGYSEDYALMALKQTDNDINESVELISKSPDILDAAIVSYVKDQEEEEKRRKEKGLKSDEEEEDANKSKRDEEKEKALSRMHKELGATLGDAENHLDMTLEEEKALLDKYSRIING